ncbi:carbohydrate esterase family 4 protein, partial [Coprinopsis marcescibilis]
IVASCTVPNTVALTFDDGPWVYLNDIATTLKNANATGTFFFIGCIYDEGGVNRVKFAYENGHQVASHTWSHKDLAQLGWDQINDELWRIDDALMKIVGVTPAIMRPPYGSFNDQVVQAVRSRSQTLVIWDFESADSIAGASAENSKNQYDQVIGRHPNTILTLNHETSGEHQVLPYAIQKLQAAGYRLVSVAECLGIQPYQKVSAPSARDVSF